MSIIILSIYDLIKQLNIEINQCLLKNFAKPGFLIFFSCLTAVVVVVVVTRLLPRDGGTATQVHAVNLIEIRLR